MKTNLGQISEITDLILVFQGQSCGLTKKYYNNTYLNTSQLTDQLKFINLKIFRTWKNSDCFHNIKAQLEKHVKVRMILDSCTL